MEQQQRLFSPILINVINNTIKTQKSEPKSLKPEPKVKKDQVPTQPTKNTDSTEQSTLIKTRNVSSQKIETLNPQMKSVDKFMESYKVIQEMVRKQKECQTKKIQNAEYFQDDLKKSSSTNWVQPTSQSMNIIKTISDNSQKRSSIGPKQPIGIYGLNRIGHNRTQNGQQIHLKSNSILYKKNSITCLLSQNNLIKK